MKVIAISNQKGGVGKTTSSINIGAGLAKKGIKTLLIDLDPQSNMTQALGIEDPEYTINGLLFHKQKIAPYGIQDHLGLIACDRSFSNFDKQAQDKLQREFILKKTMESLRGQFDYILLDCPPALGLITINAFSFAEQVYTPIEAQKFSIQGLIQVFEMIDAVREINSSLRMGGIFFTRHNTHKILNRDIEEQIRSTYKDQVMKTFIRESVALRESPHANQDIFSYAPDSGGAKDYEQLVEEILKR